MEGTSGVHLVQLCCSSGAAQSQLPGMVARPFLNRSREGDSTTSLGKLCQWSDTLTVKTWFLTYRGNVLCFSACPWHGLWS